jgi:hypothetical protein
MFLMQHKLKRPIVPMAGTGILHKPRDLLGNFYPE